MSKNADMSHEGKCLPMKTILDLFKRLDIFFYSLFVKAMLFI